MFKCVLLLFIDAIIFQPIRCIIGFFMRFLWHPVPIERDEHDRIHEYSLDSIRSDAINNFNWDEMLRNNDCAKFLGIYCSCTDDTEKWNLFSSLLDTTNRTIRRNPLQVDQDNDPEFSTDMMSGLMLVLFNKYSVLKYFDIDKLKYIIDYVTFGGYIPFDFPDLKGNKNLKRGWFFNPIMVWTSNQTLTVLSWLGLCKSLFKDWRYSVLYYLWLIFEYPSLLIACPHSQVNLPFFRVVGIAWHQIHSKFIVYCVGYAITRNILFKIAATKIYKLHRNYNAEIIALYNKYINDNDWSNEDKVLFLDLIYENNLKSTLDSSLFETKKFLDIRGFNFTTLCTKMHSPRFRNEYYNWERNPQKKQSMKSTEWRKSHRLDVYNAISLALNYDIHSEI